MPDFNYCIADSYIKCLLYNKFLLPLETLTYYRNYKGMNLNNVLYWKLKYYMEICS